MSDPRIQDIRTEIDNTDVELLSLLNRRARLVLKLGVVKHDLGLKLFDPEREQEIYDKVTKNNEGPLPSESVSRIYERIIDESRRLERTEVYDKQEDR
jgi:chorismate mutase